MFEDFQDVNILATKLHLLGDIVENVQHSRDPDDLDSSPSENFKFFIKTFMGITSMRKRSKVEKRLWP